MSTLAIDLQRLSGLLMLLAVPQPTFATLVIESSLALSVSADAGNGAVLDTAYASQGATLNPLGILNAHASAAAESGSVDVYASAAAQWYDADAGTLRFDKVGWETRVDAEQSAAASPRQGNDWSYRFTAEANGIFHLRWDIDTQAPTTDAFGLNGFHFYWTGGPHVLLDTAMTLDTTGEITRTLVAGVTYTANIQNYASLWGYPGERAAMMSGVFDWRIDATDVSAPASAILMVAGLIVFARGAHRPVRHACAGRFPRPGA